MPNWLKYSLFVGGGLFFLKLFDDSRKMMRVMREKAANATNNIAGMTIPVPTIVEGGKAGTAVVTPESRLANSNPDTMYGEGYM